MLDYPVLYMLSKLKKLIYQKLKRFIFQNSYLFQSSEYLIRILYINITFSSIGYLFLLANQQNMLEMRLFLTIF
jgi:hypothetical protein